MTKKLRRLVPHEKYERTSTAKVNQKPFPNLEAERRCVLHRKQSNRRTSDLKTKDKKVAKEFLDRENLKSDSLMVQLEIGKVYLRSAGAINSPLPAILFSAC